MVTSVDSNYIVKLADKAINCYGMKPYNAYEFAYDEAVKQLEVESYINEVKKNFMTHIERKQHV